jgi:hypothetical protein
MAIGEALDAGVRASQQILIQIEHRHVRVRAKLLF